MLIVFVDDEEQILNSLSDLFEDDFPEAKYFSNAIEAQEFIKKNINEVKLVVTDYRMPNIDGFTFLVDLMDLNYQGRVTFYSAFIDSVLLEKIKKVKDDCTFVSKPYVGELYDYLCSVKAITT